MIATAAVGIAHAQQGFGGQGGPPGGGPGGFGGPGGPGGVREDIKVRKQFDANDDGWLNKEERAKAREYLKTSGVNKRGFGGFPGGPGGPGGQGGPGQGGPGQGGPGRGGNGNRSNQNGGNGNEGPGGFPGGGFPGGGFAGGPPMGGPMGGRREAARPGRQVSPSEVKSYPDAGLYDQKVLRTIFINFDAKDWETELSDFHGTDVDVPADVLVDGKTYPLVGVHFRGNSSYNMVSAGYKRSLNLSFDLADKKARLYGYKTLNLLNANGDPTLMRGPLYSLAAAGYIPIEKTNLVKVVINGEYWGVYQNVQQFDKIFVKEHFGEDGGVRWKAPGNPNGQASLAYLGDSVDAYKRIYSMKTEDEKVAASGWAALIQLTKVLNQTPAKDLPSAIEPILDVQGALKFLALENALFNSDGYWTRTSDYNLYLDTKGKFHIIPHDFNETFLPEGGPGMGMGGPGGRPGGFPGGGFPGGPGGNGNDFPQFPGGGFPGGGFPGGPGGDGNGFPPPGGFPGGFPGGQGDQGDGNGFPPPPGGFGGPGGFPGMPGGTSELKLDPLMAEKDARKPLISKLLAVPAYKKAYLKYVGELAQTWLNWEKVRPQVMALHTLIGDEVKQETRSLSTYDAYLAGIGLGQASQADQGPRFGPQAPSLKEFMESRRRYLLSLTSVQAAMKEPTVTAKKSTTKTQKKARKGGN